MGWCSGMFGMVNLLWWTLLVIGIALVVHWLSRNSAHRSSKPADGDRAQAILRERYARGEIDKAEFDTRKRDLLS